MRYDEFSNKLSKFSYFKPEHWTSIFGYSRTLKNQIVLWQKKGKVLKLKRGIYTLSEEERKAPLPLLLISNILCAPSYVSLESALGFYGLIPERMMQVTAVTTRKTAVFKNHFGLFHYRSLKQSRFFGFQSVQDEGGVSLLIARPEKAILDKIYYDPSFRPEEGYFLENLRLQYFGRLSQTRLMTYARHYASEKVMRGVGVLQVLIRKEKE